MEKLRLGTRKSLLAWAQSGWAAREIERLNPGCSVELVGIETRGDRILDIPLQEVAGKEFFVAELDEALRSGQVDLSVHSMKDLSLDRPAGFACAAVPRRENPRDVILFGPGVLEKLSSGRMLRIGTSSPRRIENIPPFLEKALPRLSPAPRAELVEIRGNVNTRLGRVHEAEVSARRLDAVVLAFAGLIRLWRDPAGHEELSKLLRGVRWMVLPLRECPAAPAQGALAVECRVDDSRTRALAAKLHDVPSAEAAAMERALLAQWGGGCHQRFGATAVSAPGLDPLLWVRGMKPDGQFVDELRWKAPSPRTGEPWDGTRWRAEIGDAEELPWQAELSGRCVFVAHSRAVSDRRSPELARSRVWTSGTASWFRLAEMGVWVEGCAESMGFEFIKPTLTEEVLQLAPIRDWLTLTHSRTKRYGLPFCHATYQVPRGSYPPEAIATLRKAGRVFWSSGSQFDELHQNLSPGAHEACGPGKTAEKLAGRAQVFPSVEEWRKWVHSRSGD